MGTDTFLGIGIATASSFVGSLMPLPWTAASAGGMGYVACSPRGSTTLGVCSSVDSVEAVCFGPRLSITSRSSETGAGFAATVAGPARRTGAFGTNFLPDLSSQSSQYERQCQNQGRSLILELATADILSNPSIDVTMTVQHNRILDFFNGIVKMLIRIFAGVM